MRHPPQHPHNPCALGPNEQAPAKFWELLRRNTRFQKAVTRLAELDQRPRLPDGSTERQPREIGLAMVRRLRQLHPFAATALQWLVPEPLFEISHAAIPADLDLAGKQFVSLVTVKLQEGTTPAPADKANWRTYEAQGEHDAHSIANFQGRLWRRGPRVEVQESDDPRFCSKLDPLQEWRDYFERDRKTFTLSTPWRDAPPQFQREFAFLWRHLDSRTTNPITGTRVDAPCEHETNFFTGWDLMSRLGQQPNSEDAARALMFTDLARDYRIFVFPKSIRTRTEARRVADWLAEQLTRSPDGTDLPKREKEALGSPLLWDMLLVYEDRRREGEEHVTALRFTFDSLYLRLPAARRHAAKPVERSVDAVLQHQVAKSVIAEAESTRWHSWLNDFARIHSPLSGQGLVELIFPSVQAALGKSFSETTT